MIVAALVVGGITAYYFGLRVGAFAAVGSVAMFFFGLAMPSKLLWAYGLVAFYTLGVLVLGPRLPGRKENKADFFRLVRKIVGKVLGLYRQIRK